MGRFVGAVTGDKRLLRCVLGVVDEAMHSPEGQAMAGWGLGYHQGNEVLLRKSPIGRPEETVDFRSLVHDIKATDFLGTLQLAGPRHWLHDDAQPFRERGWLFAHHGSMPGFDAAREGLLEQVPNFLRRTIRGGTDSELLFHLFLSRLHLAGRLDDPATPAVEAGRALADTAQLARRHATPGEDDPLQLNLLATNGEVLIATRLGLPMFTLTVSGMSECPVCEPPAADRFPEPVSHPDLRGVVVASGLPHESPGWEAVPDGHVLHATREREVGLLELEDRSG